MPVILVDPRPRHRIVWEASEDEFQPLTQSLVHGSFGYLEVSRKSPVYGLAPLHFISHPGLLLFIQVTRPSD